MACLPFRLRRSERAGYGSGDGGSELLRGSHARRLARRLTRRLARREHALQLCHLGQRALQLSVLLQLLLATRAKAVGAVAR